VKTVPDTIACAAESLLSLDLSSNQIITLNLAIGRLGKLGSLNVCSNDFLELPTCLLKDLR